MYRVDHNQLGGEFDIFGTKTQHDKGVESSETTTITKSLKEYPMIP